MKKKKERMAWEMLRREGMDDFEGKNKQKECGMNKSIKGEQEWPPKKVSVSKLLWNGDFDFLLKQSIITIKIP